MKQSTKTLKQKSLQETQIPGGLTRVWNFRKQPPFL